MRSIILLLAFMMANALQAAAPAPPSSLKCEYVTNPLGIDSKSPKLSWIVNDPDRGEVQTAYQVIVARRLSDLNRDRGDVWDSGNAWDSGKVESSQQTAVEYAGEKLDSQREYQWKVRTWDRDGNVSPYSDPATFETAMMKPSDWSAKWVGGNVGFARKQFVLPNKSIAKARVYVCGLGRYYLHINGTNVCGDEVFNPGNTLSMVWNQYRTYDVTNLLSEGKDNVAAIMLGCNKQFNLRDRRFIMQLEVQHTDGTFTTINSDTDWTANSGGPYSSLRYNAGENYDARKAFMGWERPGFDDSAWSKIGKASQAGELVAQTESIKRIDSLVPVKITQPRRGTYVVDMGQNISGWAKLHVAGPAGTSVVLTYAENIRPDGMIDPRSSAPGGKARRVGRPQRDQYTLNGKGTEVWEAAFSLKCFRYVEIRGYPGEVTAESIRGQLVHSDILNDSSFTCSHPVLNRIQNAAAWTIRNCAQSMPVDCPHEEHSGWLGDALFTSQARLLNFDVTRFYTKWFRDIRENQDPKTGSIPLAAPHVRGPKARMEVVWSAAAVLVPWDAYMAYGDKSMLADHYDCMKQFVDHLSEQCSTDGIANERFCRLASPLGGTAHYYECVVRMADSASVLGKTADAKKYDALATTIRSSLNEKWLKGMYYDDNDQDSNCFALASPGLVPKTHKAAVFESLVDVLVDNDLSLNDSAVATRTMFDVLCENGAIDIAYRLATKTNARSFGYMTEHLGATTITEWFDGDLTQSYCHAYKGGGITAFFYKHLAGVQVVQPGYATFKIKPIIPSPEIAGDLDSVDCVVDTVRGPIRSSWKRIDSEMTMDISVPTNTSATVYVPAMSLRSVSEGGIPISQVVGVKPIGMEPGYAVLFVGSGQYSFKSNAIPEPRPYPTKPKRPTKTVIEEDFASDDDAFDESIGGTWAASGGKYTLTDPALGSDGKLGNISLHRIAPTGDYTLTATCRTASDDANAGFAIVFGYQDQSNYWFTSFNTLEPDPVATDWVHGVFRVKDGKLKQVKDFYSSFEIRSNTDYVVQLEHSGTDVVIGINGHRITKVSNILNGRIGFGTQDDACEFDNFVVDE